MQLDSPAVRQRLLSLADSSLRKFNASLLPGVDRLLGIRMPALRALAREIARGDWRSYLDDAASEYFEERMLQGLVLGYAKCDIGERLERTARFIPLIDNWAVCDCCCHKPAPGEREAWWRFLVPLLKAGGEFEVRFGTIMLMTGFIDEEHIDALLALLDGVRHEGYYARMGVAWALSVCYVKFPGRTTDALRRSSLDTWTYNKALQKIVESYRVAPEAKAAIRAMKRRG